MEPLSYILATAGHVDHGKSAVVRALTGTDPDRLPEEKLRGITIDLGFAHLMLESATARYRVGIIDVPGHEDFVKNMVAGVGSIDLALLVVAADDGWMPQTEEHLQILTYLGVSRGVVAVTKVDLGAHQEAAVLADVRAKLQGSPLHGSPIVCTSTVTGRGMDDLRRAIASVLDQTPPPRDIGKPRLALDRVFILKGVGTVVTGTLSGGALRRGDAIVVQPKGRSARVRSMQSHNESIQLAMPGSRVALNLSDVHAEMLRRGDVVTIEGLGTAHDVVDVLITSLPRSTAREFKSGTRVQIHHGTAAIPARVQLLDRDRIGPGEQGVARIHLERPMLAYIGDRFIIRDWPEQHTLAGGEVLDPAPQRRPDQSLLRERAGAPGDVRVLVETELKRARVLPRERLLVQSNYAQSAVGAALGQTDAIQIGHWLVDRTWWESVRQSVMSHIDAYHKASPERPGLPLAELALVVGGGHETTMLVADLTRNGFVQDGAVIRRASHRLALPPRLQAAGERLRAMLAEKSFDPPSRGQLVPDAIAQQALKFLVANGEAVEIGPDVILSADALQRAIEQVRQHIRLHGPATVSELKTVLNSSRRIMVPLLERLDRDGITRRDGDRRSLR